jgi:phage-related protein
MPYLEFYRKENGEKPAEEFLRSLDHKMRAKALGDLEILRDMGHRLREPYSRHLGNGVFELRTRIAKDTIRVFYFFFAGDKVVLTNGFVKKSQKTPRREIDKALTYKADWETRQK